MNKYGALKYWKETKSRGSKPRDNLDHINMSEVTRELFERFLEGTAPLGLEPTIWSRFIGIGKPGAGKPYPVIVRPRKNWLLLIFLVSFEELTTPPACAYSHETKSGALRTRAKVRSLEEVADCLRLVPCVPVLSSGDLDDGLDDSGAGDDS